MKRILQKLRPSPCPLKGRLRKKSFIKTLLAEENI
jgi:hypothetical protein